MIPHDQAATIALRLLEAGVEGADVIAAYVDQQTALGDLTDRQLTTMAIQRSDAAAEMAETLRERHIALVIDNKPFGKGWIGRKVGKAAAYPQASLTAYHPPLRSNLLPGWFGSAELQKSRSNTVFCFGRGL